jgi:hypothetical protein
MRGTVADKIIASYRESRREDNTNSGVSQMSNATKKPDVGNVTIATVGSEEEARRVTAMLDSAGIKWTKTKERGSTGEGAAQRRVGGIKILVSSSDARRAVHLLGEKGSNDRPSPPRDDSAPRVTRWHIGIDGWKRSAIEVVALVAVAGLLAALVFY